MGKKNKNANQKTGFGEIFKSIYFSRWYVTLGGLFLAILIWICINVLSN